MNANSQKLQLVGIALGVSMAASVMGLPVGIVWHRAVVGQQETLPVRENYLSMCLISFLDQPSPYPRVCRAR